MAPASPCVRTQGKVRDRVDSPALLLAKREDVLFNFAALSVVRTSLPPPLSVSMESVSLILCAYFSLGLFRGWGCPLISSR